MKKSCILVNLLSLFLFLAILLPNIINVVCVSNSVLTMIDNENKNSTGEVHESNYITSSIQDANLQYSYGKLVNGKPYCTVQLYVLPIKTITQSGMKMATCNGDSIDVMATRINAILPQSSTHDIILCWMSVIQMMLFFIMVFVFIRFILKVNKGEVFTWENIKRLRWLGFLCFISFVITIIQGFANVYYARQFIEFKDYELSPLIGIGLCVSLTISAICFLCAQIFAKGLELKEEQDLTI